MPGGSDRSEHDGRVLRLMFCCVESKYCTTPGGMQSTYDREARQCKARKIAQAMAMTVTFPNAEIPGDCMGDALRGQKKDPSKYSWTINSDGTLTFHRDGCPAMKLTLTSPERFRASTTICEVLGATNSTCG